MKVAVVVLLAMAGSAAGLHRNCPGISDTCPAYKTCDTVDNADIEIPRFDEVALGSTPFGVATNVGLGILNVVIKPWVSMPQGQMAIEVMLAVAPEIAGVQSGPTFEEHVQERLKRLEKEMTKFAKAVVEEVREVRTEALRGMVTKLVEDMVQIKNAPASDAKLRLYEASDQCDSIRAHLSSTTDAVAQLSYYEMYCENCLAVLVAKHREQFDSATNRKYEWEKLTYMCLTTLPGKYTEALKKGSRAEPLVVNEAQSGSCSSHCVKPEGCASVSDSYESDQGCWKMSWGGKGRCAYDYGEESDDWVFESVQTCHALRPAAQQCHDGYLAFTANLVRQKWERVEQRMSRLMVEAGEVMGYCGSQGCLDSKFVAFPERWSVHVPDYNVLTWSLGRGTVSYRDNHPLVAIELTDCFDGSADGGCVRFYNARSIHPVVDHLNPDNLGRGLDRERCDLDSVIVGIECRDSRCRQLALICAKVLTQYSLGEEVAVSVSPHGACPTGHVAVGYYGGVMTCQKLVAKATWQLRVVGKDQCVTVKAGGDNPLVLAPCEEKNPRQTFTTKHPKDLNHNERYHHPTQSIHTGLSKRDGFSCFTYGRNDARTKFYMKAGESCAWYGFYLRRDGSIEQGSIGGCLAAPEQAGGPIMLKDCSHPSRLVFEYASRSEGADVFFRDVDEGRQTLEIVGRSGEYLTLCEVQVWAVGKNHPVALYGAHQSSIFSGGPGRRAIDGFTGWGYWSSGSCTHTNADATPWWRAHFYETGTIWRVGIFNRVDCCGFRLGGARVLMNGVQIAVVPMSVGHYWSIDHFPNPK